MCCCRGMYTYVVMVSWIYLGSRVLDGVGGSMGKPSRAGGCSKWLVWRTGMSASVSLFLVQAAK